MMTDTANPAQIRIWSAPAAPSQRPSDFRMEFIPSSAELDGSTALRGFLAWLRRWLSLILRQPGFELIVRLVSKLRSKSRRSLSHIFDRMPVTHRGGQCFPCALEAGKNVRVHDSCGFRLNPLTVARDGNTLEGPKSDSDIGDGYTQRNLQLLGQRVQVRHDSPAAFRIEQSKLIDCHTKYMPSRDFLAQQDKCCSKMQRLHGKIGRGDSRFCLTNARSARLVPKSRPNAHNKGDARSEPSRDRAPIDHARRSEGIALQKPCLPCHTTILLLTWAHSATPVRHRGRVTLATFKPPRDRRTRLREDV